MKKETNRPELLLIPSVLKTDVFGPGSEQHRVAAEFGRLVVPEKRSNPHSNSIELAFVRLRSTAHHPGRPLMFLQGGPGASGIDGLRWSLPWFMALREVGDVIALDQRGTGLSHPCLDCLENWALPLDQPGSRAEVLRLARERVRSCAEFWRSQGVDLSGYTTEENADDVDALREALGYEQVNLYGASYGSHLALATIKRHEGHIPEICDACGNPDLGPAFRAPFTSAVPVLFVSGSLDGRTPPSNAEEVRAGFSHSQHLIVENGAHGDETLEAPGVSETIIDFLKGKPVSLIEAKLPFTFIPVAER